MAIILVTIGIAFYLYGALTNDFTAGLAAALPADGRVYVIGSGNTFSAGLITAARLKHFGGGKVRLLGTPLGDRPQFWAEGQQIVLPNSGLRVEYAAAWHGWEHGCGPADIGRCFPPNYLWGVAAGDLTPDPVIEQTLADYLAGKDTVLEWILADLDQIRQASPIASLPLEGRE